MVHVVYKIVKFFFVFCDQSDNVINGASENVNGLQLEGENVNNHIVLDKENEQAASVENSVIKQEMEVKIDKRTEKQEHRRSGNGKGIL